jgi:molecular chaperone GrpE
MSENNKPADASAQPDPSLDERDEAGHEPAGQNTSDPSSKDEGAHSEFQDAAAPGPDEGEDAAGSGSDNDEVGRLREALLRTRAEMDNLHKRSERELEKSRKFAVESLLRDLVPVIDSLDQGIEASGEAGSEGLELTRKLALDTLKRYGLQIVDPSGEAFDPQWHEAMSMVASDDHASGQVITVLQRGYRLHDRVVRAARVIVAQ